MIEKHNYLNDNEINNLSNTNNFLSKTNVLLSKEVSIGSNNVFYPNVYIEIKNGGSVVIGNNNVFFPNTFILADKGKVFIENNNIFENNINIKANMEDSLIEIKSNCRLINNIIVMGKCLLGNGSQAIGGFITIQNCILDAGEDFSSPNIEQRAGVIKGYGTAKNLQITQGHVINGNGIFNLLDIESQTNYHR